jgi:chromosomal replication initiator protein
MAGHFEGLGLDTGLCTPGPSIGAMDAELRAVVSQKLGASRFHLWFGDGVRLRFSGDGDALEVSVPNGFVREWIERHYSSSLIDAGAAITGRAVRLAIQVQDEAEPPLGDVVLPGPYPAESDSAHQDTITIPFPAGPKAPLPLPVTAPVSPPLPPSRPRFQTVSNHQLHPSPQTSPVASHPRKPVLNSNTSRSVRRLEDFITGPGNQLAHAAALEIAQSAGAAFSPLVIHGAVGLGKTHLLEGIGHTLKLNHPGLNVLETTAESFTNSFLDAMRSGTLNVFRSRYRGAHGLIIDDAHFLAAKRATQEEFLHTFNALTAKGAPIVLATDQHPRRIAQLPDELVTRFLAGMVVKIEIPDLATRKAILQARAARRGVQLPESVVGYIAEHLRTSVRELEGALNTVVAQAVLSGRHIDLNLAQFALRDTIRHTAQAIGLRDVERTVSQLFQVSTEALRSESRARAVAYPRMLAMYLARKHVGAAYSEIGRYFGGRDHSTVMAAEKKVQQWLEAEQKTLLLPGFETVGDLLANLEQVLGT